jgi:hypothetical protein
VRAFESPIGDEEASHLGDFIEDENTILPIDAAIQSNLRETTTRVLASLTPREERILRMRRLVEESALPVRRTLEKIGIPRATFYRWYDLYQAGGPEALVIDIPKPNLVWNHSRRGLRAHRQAGAG